MARDDQTWAEVICEISHATEKAALIVVDEEEYWIPFSQIHPDDHDQIINDPDPDGFEIRIAEWLAQKRGLI